MSSRNPKTKLTFKKAFVLGTISIESILSGIWQNTMWHQIAFTQDHGNKQVDAVHPNKNAHGSLQLRHNGRDGVLDHQPHDKPPCQTVRDSNAVVFIKCSQKPLQDNPSSWCHNSKSITSQQHNCLHFETYRTRLVFHGRILIHKFIQIHSDLNISNKQR